MKHATLVVMAAISSIGIDSPALAVGDTGRQSSFRCLCRLSRCKRSRHSTISCASRQERGPARSGAEGFQIWKTRQRIHEGDRKFAKRPGYRKCGSVLRVAQMRPISCAFGANVKWRMINTELSVNCKKWYSISRTISDNHGYRGATDDRSVRTFGVKPRVFGAPPRGVSA